MHRQGGSRIETGVKEPPIAPNKLRGKGIALAWKAPAMPPNAGSSALVKMNADGTVNVSVGGQEMGQGTFTAMAQIAADSAGCALRVGQGAGPSRHAVQSLRMADRRQPPDLEHGQRGAQRRQRCPQANPGSRGRSLERRCGRSGHHERHRRSPTKRRIETTLQNIVVYGLPNEDFTDGRAAPSSGAARFMPTYVTGLDAETGQGDRAVVHYTIGAQAVDIEVDLDTGKIDDSQGRVGLRRGQGHQSGTGASSKLRAVLCRA